jgi:hypothetical protein
MFGFRHSSDTRVRARRSLLITRTAGVGAIVLTVGMIPAVAVTTGARAVDTTLVYGCRSASGAYRVSARIEAAFPATGVTGRPVQPGRVTIRLTVARAAFPGPSATPAPPAAPSDAATPPAATETPEPIVTGGTTGPMVVSGTARLTTTVTENGTSAAAIWPNLTISPVPMPATGDVELVAAGAVPPVTPSTAGAVVFAAGDLDLALTTAGSAGPPGPTLGCTPDAGRTERLATVRVSGPADAPKRTAELRGTTTARAAPDPIPTHCGEYNPPDNLMVACAYLAGFSNVDKLHAAAPLGRPDPALINLAETSISVTVDSEGRTHITTVWTGQLYHNGKAELPPATATFLTFGFMPTTATMELSQVGVTTISSDLHQGDDGLYQIDSTATTQIKIRLHDVTVNGTPLDVGSHCQTAKPMTLGLRGLGRYLSDGTQEGYTVAGGGPLTGTSAIPEFSGCGVGEDLDPLFNASVSGPGNYTRMIQGTLCDPGNPEFPCSIPDPRS